MESWQEILNATHSHIDCNRLKSIALRVTTRKQQPLCSQGKRNKGRLEKNCSCGGKYKKKHRLEPSICHATNRNQIKIISSHLGVGVYFHIILIRNRIGKNRDCQVHVRWSISQFGRVYFNGQTINDHLPIGHTPTSLRPRPISVSFLISCLPPPCYADRGQPLSDWSHQKNFQTVITLSKLQARITITSK